MLAEIWEGDRMCGLTGFWERNPVQTAGAMEQTIVRMADTLWHRGPDDGYRWCDAESGVALGFRRLAIIDLTPSGRQPMVSASGRYVIAFNGEIYNYQELKRQLESEGNSPVFRGSSDTEVLLAGIEAWGLRRTLQAAAGMFAIALWDRSERTLALARDRLGVKPLYVATLPDGTVLFGSELKALRAHPRFEPRINRDTLALFFRHNCVPGSWSIFEGTRKVAPGSILRFKTTAEGCEELYWDPLERLASCREQGFSGSWSEGVDALEEVLSTAVRQRMIADVPLGAFLSGGIDSSVVVALMQKQSPRPVRTFTIGFHEGAFNEAGFSRDIATHLKTDHTELYVSPRDALAVVPLLPQIFDEPFSDCSQIPTYLVSRMARTQVTVALAGDGGDEVFGGYNRHVWSPRIWNGVGWMPAAVRRRMASALMAVGPRSWDALMARAKPLLPARFHEPNVGYKLSKLAEVLGAESADHFYRNVASHWQNQNLVLDARPLDTLLTRSDRRPPFSKFLERMLYFDLLTYLPDDNLTKVDRASMANSLEVRGPFLDHRVVEFAWRLPSEWKVRQGRGKWIVRQLLERHVPRALTERPKMGFGVPIGAWLRGPLRPWAEDLLAPSRLKSEGYLDASAVQTVWNEHLQNRRDREYFLWDVLMFEAWLQAQSEPPRAVDPAPALVGGPNSVAGGAR